MASRRKLLRASLPPCSPKAEHVPETVAAPPRVRPAGKDRAWTVRKDRALFEVAEGPCFPQAAGPTLGGTRSQKEGR